MKPFLPISLQRKQQHFIKLFLVFITVFTGMVSQGQVTVLTFPVDLPVGPWLCPTGVTSIAVECWGGGGSGGGATGNPAAGGGGAGGSYVKQNNYTVVPGTYYNFNIGTGGNGTTGAGAAGNDSWFDNATAVMAKGGNGGALASTNNSTAAGAAAISSGNIGFTAPFSYYGGGGGTGAALGVSGGGGGSSAGTGSNGNPGVVTAGGSAVTGGGAGVNGSTSSANGADNSNLGGGGAGARAGNNTNRSGGDGGDGQIRITFTHPSCPISTAVTPSATQTGCIGFTANTLTAAITLSGVTGTPTLLYQWYYNNTNSNTVVGATLISGATSSTYLPSTLTSGTRYYFCVGYATNNSCAQTNATQSLASNTVQVTVIAPMTGSILVGTGQTYTTLTAAVTAYNNACLAGPVSFLLTNNGGTYTTGETFPIVINNAAASVVNTLTIRPNTGVTTTISGSASSDAIIKVSGKYVTIDGSNNGSSTRDLTITNTSTTSPTVIGIGSTGASSINDVTLKNCNIINGVNTSSAVIVSDITSLGSAGYFTNISIQNNNIQKAYIGIYCVAVYLSGNGNGLNINSNDLTTSGANAIRRIGIYIGSADGASVANNSIGNFETLNTEFDYGIWVASSTTNAVITGNTISNLAYTGASNTGPNGIFISTNIPNSNTKISGNTISNITSAGFVPALGSGAACAINVAFASAGVEISGNNISNIKNTNTGNYGCNGINLGSTSTAANCRVFNNMIFDIAGRGATTGRGYEYNGYGIAVISGAGYDIDNNSILLNSNQTNSGYPAAINITSGVTAANAINLRNNILMNTQTQTGEHYAIQSSAANTVFNSIDFNNYYVASGNLGYRGGNLLTLANIQTGFGSNTNSKNILPVFVSSTNLHLVPLSNVSLNNLGTAIAGLTIDMDNQTRNGLTPDIGADEWIMPTVSYWVGSVSTSWLDPANWEANFIPDASIDTYITGGYNFMPEITTTQGVKALNMSAPGTPPLLTLNGGTLQVNRNINFTGGLIDGSNGTLEMKSSLAQTIPANLFQNNNLKNLIISNTNNVTGVTLAGTLDIYRSVIFVGGGRKLTTGGYLTFKSTASETAWLGQMTASNTLVGDATVERNIPLHTKAWQFLSTPITASSTQTVKQAWQEGAATANANPVPGFGTQLTSNRVGAASQPTPGFDVYTPSSPSIKIFNPASGAYVGLHRTDTAISNPRGYLVFVRGDRSVITSGAPATATIMRMKGTLHTPANPPVSINVTTTGFESIGNPYASAINFRSLTLTGGVQTDFFYLWDPKLTTIGVNSAYGYGGMQTFSWNGSAFDVTPGGGSYSGSNRNIESGQAFFVNAPFSTGTVSFAESAKVSGSNSVNRMPNLQSVQMRTNMYVINAGNRILIDGNLVQYGRSWSKSVDINDALKMNNSGENLGISRENKLLVVERRPIIERTDTVLYNMGMLRIQQYEFELIPTGLAQPGLAAFLEDNYLGTSTVVSLQNITTIQFNIVNIPGSYAANRFRLVYRQLKNVVPVTVISEESKNTSIGTKVAVVNQPLEETVSDIIVYPNPVVNKTLQLQFTKQVAGLYKIDLIQSNGSLQPLRSVQVETGKTNRSIYLPQHLASGMYMLQITGPDNKVIVRSIQVL